MKLYELNKAIADFQLEVDEETGEILNFDELENLELERDTKIENLCLWVKNLRAEAAAIKVEEENLSARRKAKDKKANNIENFVASLLSGEKFSTARVECMYRSSEAVNIPDEALVPREFQNFTVIGKPVKSEIKKYLKKAEAKGIDVPWASLEKRKKMTIK